MRSSASVVAGLALAACAYARAQDYDASGPASWYDEEVGGRPTASGARYDPDAITVAHRSLPLGSFVEVTALDSGRSIVATVADRGPFHGDRLVDLSRGAARQLGLDARPKTSVRVRTTAASPQEQAALRMGRAALLRVTGRPQPAIGALSTSPRDIYLLRVGTFSSQPRAAALARALGAALMPVDGLWRVMLGPYAGASAAQRARDAVAARGYGDAVILPPP